MHQNPTVYLSRFHSSIDMGLVGCHLSQSDAALGGRWFLSTFQALKEYLVSHSWGPSETKLGWKDDPSLMTSGRNNAVVSPEKMVGGSSNGVFRVSIWDIPEGFPRAFEAGLASPRIDVKKFGQDGTKWLPQLGCLGEPRGVPNRKPNLD